MCNCIAEIKKQHLDPIGADFKGVELSFDYSSNNECLLTGIIFRLVKKGTNRAHPSNFVQINNCPFCGKKLRGNNEST
jgi:hypothetical protein